MRQRVWTLIQDAVWLNDRAAYDRALEGVPITWQESDYLFSPRRTLDRVRELSWPVRDLAIHAAAREGQIARLDQEIDSGTPIDARNLAHETPLMLAADGGHAEVLRHLLDRGADATLLSLGGRGLLRHAVASWDPATVEVALMGGHPHPSGAFNLIPTCYAEERGREGPSRELAGRAIGLLDVLRKFDRRAWRLVSTRRSLRPLLVLTARADGPGDLQVFDWFVRHGNRPDLRDGQGRTVLAELAIEDVAPDTVGRLVGAGVDVDAPDRMGQTPLWHAVANGTPAVIKALVEAGARPDAENMHGWTPLMLATGRPRAEVEPLLQPEASASWYERARDLRIQFGEPQSAKELGLALRKAQPLDRALLVVAVTSWQGSLNQLEALLEAGADLEMRDPAGRTVLHVSLYRGEQVVRELLDRGADPLARHGAWTAADSAYMLSDGGRERRHVATARVLEAAAAVADQKSG